MSSSVSTTPSSSEAGTVTQGTSTSTTSGSTTVNHQTDADYQTAENVNVNVDANGDTLMLAVKLAYMQAVNNANEKFRSAMYSIRLDISAETSDLRANWIKSRDLYRANVSDNSPADDSRRVMQTARAAYKSALKRARRSQRAAIDAARTARWSAIEEARAIRDGIAANTEDQLA